MRSNSTLLRVERSDGREKAAKCSVAMLNSSSGMGRNRIGLDWTLCTITRIEDKAVIALDRFLRPLHSKIELTRAA